MSDQSDNLKDDLDTLDPGAEVQKAYDAAQKTPWTIARHSAAMSMGCTILAGVFGPELAGLQDKGTYPNALRDVVIVLWLLSRSPAEVMRINARQNVDEATTEAFLWAETEGIAYGSAKYMDGVRTLTEVVGGIYTSFYNMSSKGKREPDLKNGLSPAGKSVRPTGRSKRRVTTPNT